MRRLVENKIIFLKKLLTNSKNGAILYLAKYLKAVTKTVLEIVSRELTLGASQ